MYTKRLLALVGIPALVVSLSGCGIGGGGADDQSRAGNCNISEEVSSSEPLTGEPTGEITFQTTSLRQDFSEYFEGVIDAFEAEYPGTTVNWQDDPGDSSFTQRLVSDAQACKLPDVVNLNQVTAYALRKANFLMNLDQKAPGSGDKFVQSIWDSLLMPEDTDHYVMPWYWGLLSIQTFNTDLMQKAGLDPSNPPSTIMELIAAAKTVGENSGGEFYAFPANPHDRLPNDWQQMDAQITNEAQTEFTFASDPKVLAWLEGLIDLYESGALPKDTISTTEDVSTLYQEGRIVWGSNNVSALRYVQEGNPQVYETSDIAPLLDARGTSLQTGQLIGVSSTTKNPVAAAAFANFLLSVENQSAFISDPRLQNFPSTTESFQIPKLTNITGTDALARANRLAVELAQEAENSFLYAWSDGVHTTVTSELQRAMTGEKSAQQALDDAQAAANDILKRAAQ
ncbi:extracellular solute-binding protein [Lysinibacter sp. HNR]|uniref:extracellular solute-binding protein n=1 Tax=Lysinibacter sp. HNR TaxID=3031408 RepID=UPI002435B9EA|nr:extracellular solute-binding protein [Lysinibacter sp. HNR]WGD38183.1 extracellular solute-binding protein [Lysinibacter sp. HNR]